MTNDRSSPRRPAGIDRAKRRKGTPPRPSRGDRAPRKPDLPAALDPDLPPDVMRDVRRNARNPDDVARALTVAADAIDGNEASSALAYLEWAKADAPRSPAVREMLGVAYYLTERWSEALSELQAYRRLTDRQDQNHLIADCLRALDRPIAKVAEVIEAMDPSVDGDDRVAEGVIVWASALGDRGEPANGRTVLRRVLSKPGDLDEVAEHHVRVWYVAGDLAEQDGDRDDAARWFRRVAAVDDELYDVAERLERLEKS